MLTTPLTLLIVLATCLLSVLAIFFLARKYFSFFIFDHTTSHAETFSDAIGLIFGLTLAFISVSVWQSYNNINSLVIEEASTLLSIHRNLDAFQPELKEKSNELLTSYVKNVITEWPIMAKGQFDTKSYIDIHLFHLLMLRHNPINSAEFIAQQEEIRLMSHYNKMRAQRIISANSALDSPMILTLVLSAAVFLLYQCFHSMPKIRHHLFMISFLTISIGLIFFLILSYNTPFSGPNAIPPDEFQRLLELWKINPD